MKTHICRCNYSGKPSRKGTWWKWHEVCDRCGSVIQECGTRLNSVPPDVEEADFCISCLRLLMSEGINYEEAKAKYKKLDKESES